MTSTPPAAAPGQRDANDSQSKRGRLDGVEATRHRLDAVDAANDSRVGFRTGDL